jgi:DNA polymerase-3 subunit alpha
MHTIFCCVREGEKQTTNRSWSWLCTVCLIRNTISRQGRDENSLLTCQREFSEIVDKIEIYNLAREVLLPKFDIPEEFSFRRYC